MISPKAWPKSDWALALVAAITVVLFTITFWLSPLNGEDFALTRQFGPFDLVERINWVTGRSLEQFSTFNARLGEQGAIFWLSMPSAAFTVAAVAAFLMLNFLLGNFFERGDQWLLKTLLSVAGILLIWPSLDVFFWRTGNAGYGQPIVLTLGLMFAYATSRRRAGIAQSRLWWIALAVLGFLAGISFENVPPAVGFFVAGALVMDRETRSRLRAWLPIVAMLAGWLLLVNAPSTIGRRELFYDYYGFTGYNVAYLQQRVPDTLAVFWDYSSILLVVTVVAAVVLWWMNAYRRMVVLSLLTAALVVMSVVAAPYTEARSFTLAWALMFAVSLAALNEVMTRSTVARAAAVTGLALGIIVTLQVTMTYADFATAMNSRDAYIKQRAATDACQTGIRVDAVAKKYPQRVLNNRSEWFAQFSFKDDYYGCTIIVVPDPG